MVRGIRMVRRIIRLAQRSQVRGRRIARPRSSRPRRLWRWYVRRMTVASIVTLAAAGIYALLEQESIRTGPEGDESDQRSQA